MNLRQLRYVAEIAHGGFNLSTVAEQLHTTQPGISLQLRQLEDELGVRIFERHGKRLTGLTEPGKAILALAESMLRTADDIREVGAEYGAEQRGTLTIATTHTQARYALPHAVQAFRRLYPEVRLRIQQGNPTQIAQAVASGEADFAIATEAIAQCHELAMLPCYQWNRCVVAPPGHPLLEEAPLTLEAIARYPIITYDFAFAGRSIINKAFAERRLSPNVVLTAIDSDVIKTYVELGLGVGLLAKMAYDSNRDINLRAVDAAHLFADSTTSIGIRRGRYLRGYMYTFIELFAPHLTRNVVESAVHPA